MILEKIYQVVPAKTVTMIKLNALYYNLCSDTLPGTCLEILSLYFKHLSKTMYYTL